MAKTTAQPKVKVTGEVPADLRDRARAHPYLSMSTLIHLGLEWAVVQYGQVYAPGEIAAASLPLTRPLNSNSNSNSNSTSNPADPSSLPPIRSDRVVATATVAAKRISIDPVGDALKPWKDHRKHEWYDLSGFMEYLGLTQDVIAKVIDWDEDTDLDPQERPILDRAAIERIFVNLSSKAYASVDRYHAVNAWFEARDADERLLAARELQT
jgi:hypothetical protein